MHLFFLRVFFVGGDIRGVVLNLKVFERSCFSASKTEGTALFKAHCKLPLGWIFSKTKTLPKRAKTRKLLGYLDKFFFSLSKTEQNKNTYKGIWTVRFLQNQA